MHVYVRAIVLMFKVSGIKIIHINFGLKKKFIWCILIADVKCPIIGADFLKHFELLPDLARCRLIDSRSLISVAGIRKSIGQANIQVITKRNHVSDAVQNLFKQYPNLQKTPKYQEKPLHDTVHVKMQSDFCATLYIPCIYLSLYVSFTPVLLIFFTYVLLMLSLSCNFCFFYFSFSAPENFCFRT